MGVADDRPDPDAVLRRVQQEQARAKRGKLKIFFGFAPGVGKTYRMLQVGRELATQERVDVVIGLVEDHKRTETAWLAQGLEQIPRLKVDYRGHVLEEFNLDAALARMPQVILLDELAHTNAPGLRHRKRFQDVKELLDAGIDVFTTMNVQHIESLNDVIAQITRVQVRETVPDSVLDDADTIELVDIAPEELLARLKQGKVYLPDQAQRAAQHFFQRGNLLALRELALRRTAQHVDDEVREYREEHGVAAPWPAGERILVCVGPAPSSGRLVRAAARMAFGLRCPWVAAFVEITASRPMTDADRKRLEGHLRVAETLGATVTRLSGVSVSSALLQYCRKNNVTRVVIGKPTHSRFRDLLRGSLLDDVVRGSGDIEVHVISGDDSLPEVTRSTDTAQETAGLGYVYAIVLAIATLSIAMAVERLANIPDPEMLFLVSVMIAAVWFGRGPSILTAALGVASYDFFFVPPVATFSVEDRRYFLTFGMMFGVSFVISELAARLRRQERDASGREERTAALYALSRELASTETMTHIAQSACRQAVSSFAAKVVVLTSEDGGLRALASEPRGTSLQPKELGVARWSFEHASLAGCGTDTLPGASVLSAPLVVGKSRLGVLVLILGERRGLRSDQLAFLDVFCRQVAVALERARLAEEAKHAVLRAKTEEMRASLLSAVSHDLRTPLSSITGAATALRDDAGLTVETRAELVESVVAEAERLERLVSNLLDMTRLESGGVALRKDWVPIDEMIGSTLTRMDKQLGKRKITVSLADDLPLVYVDPVLFEQVFVNLLENAEKYTPPETAIEIEAKRVDGHVCIDISDHGPGLPSGQERRIFEKFHRGPQKGIAGAGLGLPICKGIVEAHGGTIHASNNKRGGASFHIVIPSGGVPPMLSVTGESP